MQTNLAYDLARFDVEARQRVVEESPKANELKIVKPRRKKASPFKGVVVAMSAIAVCSAILYTHVMINESYTQISNQKKALDAAVSEGVRLQSEIDRDMSLKNVEDYAIDVLGMQRIDKTQIQYIKIKSDSVIEINNKGKNKGPILVLKDNAKDLLEYLGF
ncbi:MAG: hypothetical protein GX967_02160 [Clostridiales bacterium]|nr:hypothetical protein [Clostridiales bacterium]